MVHEEARREAGPYRRRDAAAAARAMSAGGAISARATIAAAGAPLRAEGARVVGPYNGVLMRWPRLMKHVGNATAYNDGGAFALYFQLHAKFVLLDFVAALRAIPC
jgi:hypothetical protein